MQRLLRVKTNPKSRFAAVSLPFQSMIHELDRASRYAFMYLVCVQSIGPQLTYLSHKLLRALMTQDDSGEDEVLGFMHDSV